MLCFKNYTFGSKNCNHQDQLETFETCLFIVQFQLALFLLKPVGMPMSDKTVQPEKLHKGCVSIFNIYRDKNAIWKLIRPRNGMWTCKYIHLPMLSRIYLVTLTHIYRQTQRKKKIKHIPAKLIGTHHWLSYMGPGQATSSTHTKGKSSQLGSQELILGYGCEQWRPLS